MNILLNVKPVSPISEKMVTVLRRTSMAFGCCSCFITASLMSQVRFVGLFSGPRKFKGLEFLSSYYNEYWMATE